MWKLTLIDGQYYMINNHDGRRYPVRYVDQDHYYYDPD